MSNEHAAFTAFYATWRAIVKRADHTRSVAVIAPRGTIIACARDLLGVAEPITVESSKVWYRWAKQYEDTYRTILLYPTDGEACPFVAHSFDIVLAADERPGMHKLFYPTVQQMLTPHGDAVVFTPA